MKFFGFFIEIIGISTLGATTKNDQNQLDLASNKKASKFHSNSQLLGESQKQKAQANHSNSPQCPVTDLQSVRAETFVIVAPRCVPQTEADPQGVCKAATEFSRVNAVGFACGVELLGGTTNKIETATLGNGKSEIGKFVAQGKNSTRASKAIKGAIKVAKGQIWPKNQ